MQASHFASLVHGEVEVPLFEVALAWWALDRVRLDRVRASGAHPRYRSAFDLEEWLERFCVPGKDREDAEDLVQVCRYLRGEEWWQCDCGFHFVGTLHDVCPLPDCKVGGEGKVLWSWGGGDD